MKRERLAMQNTVWKSLFICLIGLICVARGQEGISVPQNLSGVYNYVSVKDLLRILPEDPFFLALVCPKMVIVNESNAGTVANVTLVADEEGDSRCVFSSNGSTAAAEVAFQMLSSGTSPINNSEGGKISLPDLTNHFPLFDGNVGNAELQCPLLNLTVSNTQIRVQDIGLFYSLINHYRSSGTEIGTLFSELDRSSVAPIEESFSLNIALDTSAGIGCSYLKEGDEARLRGEVQKLLELETTATPDAEVKPSATANATEENGEKACFPAAAQVKVKNGSMVTMSELKMGDEVVDGDGSFSKVVMFTHSDGRARWEFVRLKTGKGSVVASRSHYIYANGALKTAGSVKPGELLTVHGENSSEKASAEPVLSKETVYARGLYNPQTASGKLVVFWDGDGVRCSAYTASVSPPLAHSLLAPLRLLATLLPK